MKKTIIYFGNYDLLIRNAAGNRVFFNTKILKNNYRIINIFYTKDKTVKKRKLLKYKGFEIYALPYPNNLLEWISNFKIFGFIKSIFLNNNDFNIHSFVFYHSLFVFFHTFFVMLFLRNRNIKLIFDIVEFDVSNKKNFFMRLLRNIDFFFSNKVLPFFSDGILVISKRMENFFKLKKVFYLPPLNSIRPSFFKKKGPLKFLFAGTLGEINRNRNLIKDRIDFIIDLVKDHGNVFLDIYGIQRNDFISCFPSIAIPNNVNFFGYIKHEKLLLLLKIYDFVFIYRMNSEKNNFGFPTKFAEAYSANIPIITTPISDVKNYINNGINGYLIPFDKKKAKVVFSNIVKIGRLDLLKNPRAFSNNAFNLSSYKVSLLDFFRKI
jgi:glycosyltransferase involved in cell wall biosynthesis